MAFVVGTRDSIYYLAYLASALQGRERRDNESTSQNPDFSRAKNTSSAGRAVNHLSTILSRGRITQSINEEDRVVAVTANLFDSSGCNVWVMSSPATSPVPSPRISPSSSSSGVGKDGGPRTSTPSVLALSTKLPLSPTAPSSASSGAEQDDGSIPASTSAAVPGPSTGAPWHNFIHIDRNSASGDDRGRLYQKTLPADAGVPPAKINTFDRTALKALSFSEYSFTALETLRTATSIIRHNPRTVVASQAIVDAQMFFATACVNKIKSRIKSFVRVFGSLPNLEAWNPSASDETPDSIIEISNFGVAKVARFFKVEIPSDGKVRVDKDTMGPLFQTLIRCITMAKRALDSENIAGFVGLSSGLHKLIRCLPEGMWHTASLIKHLKNSQAVAHSLDTEEDETDNEMAVTDDETVSLPPICAIFVRMAQAVCAWTTGVRYLLDSPVSKAAINVNITVVDFPRRPIGEVSVDDLLDRWSKRGRWAEPLFSVMETEIRNVKDLTQTSKGAVHCEAGLVSSLLLRCRKSSSFESPDTAESERTKSNVDGQKLHEPEPEILETAFADLTTLSSTPNGHLEFRIGVAKKCCPLCRLLIEILQTSPASMNIEFAGSHSRFHPWVPPHWLPVSVLETIETALLIKVTEMVQEKRHLFGSRASSTSSISIKSSNSDNFRTTADEGMEKISIEG